MFFSTVSALILLQLLTSTLAADSCYQCMGKLEDCKQGNVAYQKMECATGKKIENLIADFNTQHDEKLERYSTELVAKSSPYEEDKPVFSCLKFTYHSLIFNETIALSSCLHTKASWVCDLAERLLESKDCHICEGDFCNNSALSVLSNRGMLSFTVFLAVLKSII